MKKTILIFGALILGLLTLFQLSTYSVTSVNLNIELVIGCIAIVFFIFGIVWKQKNSTKSETLNPSTTIDTSKISALGITEREYEILVKIYEGHSNKEIGMHLFISESTVKTHISNLFSKLEAKRRTQAIQKAKELQIIV